MSDEDWLGKGDRLPRRSPRRRGKTCGRPFRAPRLVADEQAVREESQAVILTETEMERDMQDREEAPPLVIPFIPDMTGSDKEIAHDSYESVKDTVQDNAEQTGQVSDTTGSTPDIFKSPDRRDATNVETRAEIVRQKSPETIGQQEVQNPFMIELKRKIELREQAKLVRVTFVPETQLPEGSDDSDDNIPIATSLQKPKIVTCSLTFQQIKDCREGPQGESAVGVTVAKMFEGVEFRGTVDRFRQARKRMYYHVTYTDGDEEEYTQTELRDGYVRGLSEDIEREWAKFTSQTSDETELADSSESDDFSSDKSSDEEIPKPPKKKRKENAKSSKKKTTKSKKTKQVSGKDALSDQLLPLAGSNNVTSEAYAKLTNEQQESVAANINLKTKKVYD